MDWDTCDKPNKVLEKSYRFVLRILVRIIWNSPNLEMAIQIILVGISGMGDQ
jgi:hypothetical protein